LSKRFINESIQTIRSALDTVVKEQGRTVRKGLVSIKNELKRMESLKFKIQDDYSTYVLLLQYVSSNQWKFIQIVGF